MAYKRYYSAYGRIVKELVVGEQTGYLVPDALGSVVNITNKTNVSTYSARYKPYGGVLASTGTAPSFTWVGRWGYNSAAGRPHSESYNRRRIVSTTEGRWTSVDPLWPYQAAYGYVDGSPLRHVDPLGLSTMEGCPPGVEETPPEGRNPLQPYPTTIPTPGGSGSESPPFRMTGGPTDPFYGLLDFVADLGRTTGRRLAPAPSPHLPAKLRPWSYADCAQANAYYGAACQNTACSGLGRNDCAGREKRAQSALICAAARQTVLVECDFNPNNKPWRPNPCGHLEQILNRLNSFCNCWDNSGCVKPPNYLNVCSGSRADLRRAMKELGCQNW